MSATKITYSAVFDLPYTAVLIRKPCGELRVLYDDAADAAEVNAEVKALHGAIMDDLALAEVAG